LCLIKGAFVGEKNSDKVFVNFWRISAPLFHWFNVMRDESDIIIATVETKKTLEFAETNHEQMEIPWNEELIMSANSVIIQGQEMLF